MQETKETSLITKKDLRSVFWRSFTMQSSWSFDKMMAYGFMYSIEKPLRKIYPKDDDYFEALHRHTETFNITPHVSPFVIDLSVAMEQECAKADNFNKESINNLKVGLMGPLSGIGDSFFWGTFRVITAGIGIAFAQQGSILGALLYFFLYTAIHFLTKYIYYRKCRLQDGNQVPGELCGEPSYRKNVLRGIHTGTYGHRSHDWNHGDA